MGGTDRQTNKMDVDQQPGGRRGGEGAEGGEIRGVEGTKVG